MKDFSYSTPTTLAQATDLLAQANGRARLLAGGTDILVQLREGLRDADLVIDIKKIPELMELNYSASKGLRLGASVPCYRVYENAEISKSYPALADATRIVGGWQIQSRASVGGNLCNSSPAADTIPSLIAHGVNCVIAGPKGQREVKVEEFCTGPGKNVLQPGELLVTLVFPPPAAKSGSAYERFIPRNEMDIAVAGAGSCLELSADGKTVQRARIGLAASDDAALGGSDGWVAELELSQPFARRYQASGTIGRYSMEHPYWNSYEYWDVGVSAVFEPVTLDLRYHDTSHDAAQAWFFNPEGQPD